MKQFLRNHLEKAVLIGFLLTVAVGAVASVGADMEDVRGSVVRLHVIANSDTAFDQGVKLAVRDRIVEEAQTILTEAQPQTQHQAEGVLSAQTQRLEQTANRWLAAHHIPYAAQVRVGASRFPVRVYEDRLLPAGTYRTVRVELGEGSGRNWWCVLFPRLCLPAVTKDWGLTTGADALTSSRRVSVRVALWDWLMCRKAG